MIKQIYQLVLATIVLVYNHLLKIKENIKHLSQHIFLIALSHSSWYLNLNHLMCGGRSPQFPCLSTGVANHNDLGRSPRKSDPLRNNTLPWLGGLRKSFFERQRLKSWKSRMHNFLPWASHIRNLRSVWLTVSEIFPSHTHRRNLLYR